MCTACQLFRHVFVYIQNAHIHQTRRCSRRASERVQLLAMSLIFRCVWNSRIRWWSTGSPERTGKLVKLPSAARLNGIGPAPAVRLVRVDRQCHTGSLSLRCAFTPGASSHWIPSPCDSVCSRRMQRRYRLQVHDNSHKLANFTNFELKKLDWTNKLKVHFQSGDQKTLIRARKRITPQTEACTHF